MGRFLCPTSWSRMGGDMKPILLVCCHMSVLLGSKLLLGKSTWGCRRSRVVTFTAIRLRGPGFKPRPGQKFENENFCLVVKACHPCRVRLIKTPLYKT